MTTINFDALQAEDGVKVLLVPATIIETDGTGTSYDDFSAFASVYVTAQAGLREGWRRNDPSLTIIVEHSDDGLSWSTAASFTFGRNDTTGSALVSSPKVHMRARWTVANLSAWQIVSVTAAPTYLDSPSGSGNSSPSVVTADVVTDSTTFAYSHVFDLGHASVATVTAQLVSFAGDGETLGSAPGDIQLAVGITTSADNSHFTETVIVTGGALYPDNTLIALTTPGEIVAASGRYLRVQGDWEDSGFNEYAGPNQPVGTIRISVEYV